MRKKIYIQQTYSFHAKNNCFVFVFLLQKHGDIVEALIDKFAFECEDRGLVREKFVRK